MPPSRSKKKEKVPTYTLTSNLKDILKQYYVRIDTIKGSENDGKIEYILQDEYEMLDSSEASKYKNLTQGELAAMAGLRPNGVSEIANLRQTSINIEHLEKVAAALQLKSISEIIEFKIN